VQSLLEVLKAYGDHNKPVLSLEGALRPEQHPLVRDLAPVLWVLKVPSAGAKVGTAKVFDERVWTALQVV
jgi:hypothetical protein